MKTITRYQADDGIIFDNEERCRKYEALCRGVVSAMSVLVPRPTGCDFLNGSGFITHTQDSIKSATTLLASVAMFHYEHTQLAQWFYEWSTGQRHVSHVARLVDDGDDKCLREALYRFMCMDASGREWGQPYYAMMQDREDKQVCIKM